MDESRFSELLAEVGEVTAARDRQLSLPVRVVYHQILQKFAGTGSAPTPDQVDHWAADAGVDPTTALASLVQFDLAECDPDTERILGAYPFCADARGHAVAIGGGASVQAYCAVDALGISAMLDRDVTITSTDPQSGVEIHVQVRDGRPTWSPPDAVVTLPTGEIADFVDGDQQTADTACPSVNFHASIATADTYQHAHGLSLEILTINQAVRFASVIFGSLLSTEND